MDIGNRDENMYQACIDACNRCAQICNECFQACLNEPDVNERRNCISLLNECAQMCQMSSSIMSTNGQFLREHCELCANICEKCGAECDMFKDDHCRNCATECYACMDECRRMGAML
ncbi:four-helix bundle copper-binding protein [Clostridium sp. SHJSY1]|uniref:four-helix bundle copper-binding protein n=1 Tax=Clostridium sp. SHJSY1 TaxID=2942483 RepID=UPI002876D909|nr:four-helix bundle copper-binding protein [Clostridium sp. SHJSY1]MDS0525200.1 four-helix bundle copper-binding protein [Clostridium sp. SHJSY1]